MCAVDRGRSTASKMARASKDAREEGGGDIAARLVLHGRREEQGQMRLVGTRHFR
jgi:hypothetical protein